MPVTFPLPDMVSMIGEPQMLATGDVLASASGVTREVRSATRRWRVEFEMAPLDTDQKRLVSGALDRAIGDRLIVELPMRVLAGPDPVPTGVQVNTLWSSLYGLSMKGLPSGLVLRENWFITIVTGGRNYLYTIAADSPAGTTTRTVQITSLPRVHHAVNDPILFAPVIEGRVERTHGRIDASTYADGISFAVEEPR